MDAKQELLVKRVMGVFTIIFALGALAFLVMPDQIIMFINDIGEALGFKVAAPPVHNAMWVTLSVAMMVIITVLSYMVWKDPRKNSNVLLPIVICKFTSSILGVYFFIFVAPALGNIRATITDLPIAIIILFMHRIATKA